MDAKKTDVHIEVAQLERKYLSEIRFPRKNVPTLIFILFWNFFIYNAASIKFENIGTNITIFISMHLVHLGIFCAVIKDKINLMADMNGNQPL